MFTLRRVYFAPYSVDENPPYIVCPVQAYLLHCFSVSAWDTAAYSSCTLLHYNGPLCASHQVSSSYAHWTLNIFMGVIQCSDAQRKRLIAFDWLCVIPKMAADDASHSVHRRVWSICSWALVNEGYTFCNSLFRL